MKKCLTILAIALLPLFSKAQNIPFVQIQNIQGWQGQFLPDTCNDGPNPQYLGDTVRIRGVALLKGGLNETTGQTRWIWIRDITATPSTPFANISVRSNGPTTPQDINTFNPGDTIEVVGIVEEFAGGGAAGETQINPLANGVTLLSFEPGPAPLPALVQVGELNGALNSSNQPTNRISTGEKYEGNFIELENVTVTAVTASAGRCNFTVKDANDNYIRINDRFKVQRTANGFVPPNVGDQFVYLKGILEGSKNGCPGSGQNNVGYNLNPFDTSHYKKGVSAPAIGSIKKSIACPTNNTPVTVSVSAVDDGTVTEVKFFYSANGLTYTELNGNSIGNNRFSAQFPGQPTGTTVRYYFRATDNQGNATTFPNVNNPQINPLFYNVSNTTCTIRDIQFTPYAAGRSGYIGDTLNFQGIVTASAVPGNLGFVYIQQPDQNEWAGIWVNGGSLITGFNVGDLVSVTGTIEEYFNFTRISNISAANLVSPNQTVPSPINLNPALFTNTNDPNAEKYEGMLVRLQNPVAGQPLFVVDTNADAASARNNGEYRVGADVADPNTGCRVLAGRQTNTTFSSLNFSYVNSPRWATQDGTMAVPVVVVDPGAQVNLIQGVMHFSFFNYKLLPRNNQDADIILSIEEQIKAKGFALYPNPNQGQFKIQIQEGISVGKIEVFDALGKNIFAGNPDQNLVQIQIPVEKTGIYKVRISDSKGKILGVESISVLK